MVLLAISKEFGKSVDWLLTGQTEEYRPFYAHVRRLDIPLPLFLCPKSYSGSFGKRGSGQGGASPNPVGKSFPCAHIFSVALSC